MTPTDSTLSDRDRRELRELVDGYAVLVDDRDFAGVAGLFTPGGVLVAPDPPERLTPTRTLTGPHEIGRELARLEGFRLTFHGVLAHRVTGDGDASATGVVHGVAHHVYVGRGGAQQAKDLTWHVRYRDHYAREAGAWRFARREITIETVETRVVTVAEASE